MKTGKRKEETELGWVSHDHFEGLFPDVKPSSNLHESPSQIPKKVSATDGSVLLRLFLYTDPLNIILVTPIRNLKPYIVELLAMVNIS